MHEPYISEVEVPRPGELGGGTWHLTNLANIVAVFGKNGSGKSKLLRAWRTMAPETSHYVVPERTGELDYQPQFLTQQLNFQSRMGESQRNFSNDYRRQVISRIQAYFAARGNHRGDVMPTDPADIERYLGILLPDFLVELSGIDNPPYRLIRTADDTRITQIDQLSSGEAQVLTLGLDILTIAGIWEIQNPQSRLILIDEPDAHIHPDLLVRFADFLVKVATHFKLQVVLATHSPTLLAALGQFGDEHTSVLYLDRTATAFRAEPFSLVLKELAACLGGHALMGPLFGVPLLLVEGDDDYRIWSQVPRYHRVSFSALPCGGQQILQHQRSLERVLAALRAQGQAPAGFAIVDGDKGKPEVNRETPQDHIRFIQLGCYESENLFLTDEVLASIGLTWDEASERIRAGADRFGAKATQVLAVAGCNRQTTDIKSVISELSAILDDKPVHWTIRVAKVVGSARPTGQVSEFLGEEVVVSLWGPEPISEVIAEDARDA